MACWREEFTPHSLPLLVAVVCLPQKHFLCIHLQFECSEQFNALS